MMESTHDFFIVAQRSVAVFDAWAGRYSPAAVADHICYKCGSSEEFESIRKLFESESAYIYQSIISNRRIAFVKFTKAIPTALGDIWFLELSDQKPDGSQKSEFDHIEIYPTAGSMKGLVGDLESKGVLIEKIVRPHHTTFDLIIEGSFKVRIEPEPLVTKIVRDEMRLKTKTPRLSREAGGFL